jgi:hypothetical protein
MFFSNRVQHQHLNKRQRISKKDFSENIVILCSAKGKAIRKKLCPMR